MLPTDTAATRGQAGQGVRVLTCSRRHGVRCRSYAHGDAGGHCSLQRLAAPGDQGSRPPERQQSQDPHPRSTRSALSRSQRAREVCSMPPPPSTYTHTHTHARTHYIYYIERRRLYRYAHIVVRPSSLTTSHDEPMQVVEAHVTLGMQARRMKWSTFPLARALRPCWKTLAPQ